MYDLLNDRHRDFETVYLKHPDWLLCEDKHPGNDIRYLVMFKDMHLHTIRNLTFQNLPMLHEMKKMCNAFLDQKHGSEKWFMYFNYSPSVMQLHLHITKTMQFSAGRSQPLNCVMMNLKRDGEYYKNALILLSRTSRVEGRVKNKTKRCLQGTRLDANV